MQFLGLLFAAFIFLYLTTSGAWSRFNKYDIDRRHDVCARNSFTGPCETDSQEHRSEDQP